MAENDEKTGTKQDGASSDDGGSTGFLGRFGGGFATVAGGVAAFALTLVVGVFVAIQLLGGPGEGSGPGPVSANGPSSQAGSGSSGSSDGGGSDSSGNGSPRPGTVGDTDDFEDPAEPPNPATVIQPDNQSSSEEPQPNSQPEDSRPASFAMRLDREIAEPYENITWRGNHPGSRAGRVVLQNKQGGNWVDFLEEARVSGGGRYEGTFAVGTVGVQEFRAVDPRNGSVSNVVSIQIY